MTLLCSLGVTEKHATSWVQKFSAALGAGSCTFVSPSLKSENSTVVVLSEFIYGDDKTAKHICIGV